MVVVALVDVVVGSGGGGMDGCSCSGGGRNIIPDMYHINKFIFSIKVYIKTSLFIIVQYNADD